MTYEEFIAQVKQKAHEELGYPFERMEFYPEGFTSDEPKTAEWIRDSNLRYMGREDTKLLTDFLTFTVQETDDIFSIRRIASRRLYEDAKKNGFDEAFKTIRKAQMDMDTAQVDMGRLKDRKTAEYDKIRSQLIIRPLNYSLHIRDLQGFAYRKVGDFVLALYQLLGDAGGSLVTSKIRREELKNWGMEGQEEKVIQDALGNTARLYPACVFNVRTQKEEDFLATDFRKEDITIPTGQIMLTTFKTTNGAASLFYPGVIEKMMGIMGGPFTAVFMNINDIMIFPPHDQMAYRYARSAKESGKMGEMLSGKTYFCDSNGIHAGTVSIWSQQGHKGN